MRVNWQAYDDGLLEPEERRLAEDALRTDPMARKQLEGLRSFRAMVRGAALREAVPHKRLHSILRSVAGGGRSTLRRYLTLGATAVAATALAFFAFRSLSAPSSGNEMREYFSTFNQAQTWANRQTGLVIPRIELASLGTFDSVHCTHSSACFDYIVDGETLHVGISRAKIDNDHCGLMMIEGKPLYIDSQSGAISFPCSDGANLTINGCDQKVRIKAALLLYSELKN